MRRASTETAWLDALYRDSSADLLAYLHRRCRTPDDAADCLAETYLVAWRKRGDRPEQSELRPWVFGIARNLALRGHEHNGRLAAATKDLADSLSNADSQTREDGDDHRLRLCEALGQLSRVDQEIITMLSWDGLKPADVAKILGLSPNVVRVRAHRARTKLREELADLEGSTELTLPTPGVDSGP